MPAAHSNRWVLLVTVAAGLLLIVLDSSILYTALPILTHELGATATQGLWITNVYPLVVAGLLLGTGTLGSRVGHRRMFLVGLVLFGVASIVAAYSPTAEILIEAWAFLAVGAAAMMPATPALIRVTFEDDRERNVAIAVWGSLSVVDAAPGPIVGGFLLGHFWWGPVFLINVPVVVVAFILALIVAPKVAGDATKPWNVVSPFQVLVALSTFVIAIKESAHAGRSWAVPAISPLVAILTGALFVRRQLRLPFPLLNFLIFRSTAFTSGVLAVAFSLFVIGGVELATTQHFQLVAGFAPLEARMLVSAAAFGSLPTALLGGAFLHRIGLHILIAGGLAAGSLTVLLATWGITRDLDWLIAGLASTGAGIGTTMSTASTVTAGNVSMHRAGMASSVEEVSYEFGSLFAVTILGSLLAYLYTVNVVFPAGTLEAVRNGMASVLVFANEAGADGVIVCQAAGIAFDHVYTVVMYMAAGVLAVSALITGIPLQHYGPGPQSSAYPIQHQGNRHGESQQAPRSA